MGARTRAHVYLLVCHAIVYAYKPPRRLRFDCCRVGSDPRARIAGGLAPLQVVICPSSVFVFTRTVSKTCSPQRRSFHILNSNPELSFVLNSLGSHPWFTLGGTWWQSKKKKILTSTSDNSCWFVSQIPSFVLITFKSYPRFTLSSGGNTLNIIKTYKIFY